MKIDFQQLIADWNKKNPEDRLNKSRLAREMVAEGLYESEVSAINMISHYNRNKDKGVSWALLKFLVRRFKKQGSKIITWDN